MTEEDLYHRLHQALMLLGEESYRRQEAEKALAGLAGAAKIPTIAVSPTYSIYNLLLAISRNQKIEAIREYRGLTRASLKEAKEAVELVTNRISILEAERSVSPSKDQGWI